jgi:hypothetical protein
MGHHFNPYLEGLGDLPIPDLIALVHSAVGANETYELEWKLEFPLETRMRRAALAKHIMAFANRDPDRAARTFKGHAFLLIGVEPGAWGSAPDLDPAELVQQLEPFTGSDLAWHPVYAECEGHRVLVIVMDPPRWGDPIHRFARGAKDDESGKEIKAGAVFVRLPGISRPADDSQLKLLAERAAVPRPRLTVSNDWNLGARGDYIAVNVSNGSDGRATILREIGFTMAGACTVDETPDDPGSPTGSEAAFAYASLPIQEEAQLIEPGEILRFRVPMGAIPWCWDEATAIYPYAYFDEGHWLVGDPTALVGQLIAHGWRAPVEAPEMFSEMTMTYVSPPSMAGLRARLRIGGEASR